LTNPPNLIIGSGDTAYFIDAFTLRAEAMDVNAMRAHANKLIDAARQHQDAIVKARLLSNAAVYFGIVGDTASAQNYIRKAIVLQPDGEPAPRVVSEIRQAQLIQFDEKPLVAEQLLIDIVKRCRENSALSELLDFALQHLGKVQFDLARYEDALATFEEALLLRTAKSDAALIASTEMAIRAVKRRAQSA
jgi:tetratricopeptide (TPR) repeat protein